MAWGPPFIESQAAYPDMLVEACWKITEHVDVTAHYYETIGSMEADERKNADKLIELHDEDGFADRLAASRARLAAVERNLIRREQFSAKPAVAAAAT